LDGKNGRGVAVNTIGRSVMNEISKGVSSEDAVEMDKENATIEALDDEMACHQS
jgi:hypothetical protein